MAYNKWTQSEYDILTKNYKDIPGLSLTKNSEHIMDKLPNRKVAQILAKVRYLNLSSLPVKGVKYNKWTRIERQRLAKHFHCTSQKELQRKFRGRSWSSICSMGHVLGFKRLKITLTQEQKDYIITNINKKTGTEIAHDLNIRKGDVYKHVKTLRMEAEKDIKPSKPIRISERVSDLNPQTYQILLGTVLGSNRELINDNELGVGFTGSGSYHYRDFTIWSAQMFKPYMAIIDIKDHPIMRSLMKLPKSKLLEEMGMDLVADGEVPMKHIARLDSTGLMMWYLLKGDARVMHTPVNSYPNPAIRATNYNHESLAEAVECINKKFDVAMKVYINPKTNKTHAINMYRKARNRFFPEWEHMMKQLQIPSCMSVRIPQIPNNAIKGCGPLWWSDGELKTFVNNIDKSDDELLALLPTRNKISIAKKRHEHRRNMLDGRDVRAYALNI